MNQKEFALSAFSKSLVAIGNASMDLPWKLNAVQESSKRAIEMYNKSDTEFEELLQTMKEFGL